MRRIIIFVIGLMLCATASVAWATKGCLECHDKALYKQGKTIHQPVAEEECESCHNPHVARYKALLPREGADFCYGCHAEQKRRFGQGSVHAPVAQGDCLSCHAAHVSSEQALLKQPVAEICLTCHQEIGKDITVVHQPFQAGNCTICHEPHNANNLQLLKDTAADLCRRCHPDPDALAGHQDFPVQVADCLSCHNPHGSTRPGLLRRNLHKPYSEGCASCHNDKNLAEPDLCLSCHAQVATEMRAAHSHLLPGPQTCTRCHSPHASDQQRLLRGPMAQLCQSCHGDTFRRVAQAKHQHPQNGQCVDCHQVHGSGRTAMLRADGNSLCSRCHESQGTFSHPVGSGVIDPRVNQDVTCLTCHNPMGTDYRYHLKLSGEKALCVQCHRSY